MPLPVKISDRLLALARNEAQQAHRSTTAQIEHWATLGRAVETLVAYRDMLQLKRAGQALPVPVHVPPGEVHDLLMTLVASDAREPIAARLREAGGPVYTSDPRYPGMVVEVQPDGTRTPGVLEGRRFVPAARRVAAARAVTRRPRRARKGA